MDADVIVVGAGPSGLVVAEELRRQGCSVLVLERRESGVQSRAGSVLPRVLELLDYRGHAQAFLDRALELGDEPLSPFHLWAGLQPIRWKLLGGAFPYRLTVPQGDTETLLLRFAEEAGARIRRGETVTGLTQSDTGVDVTITAGDGEQRTYTAAWVVGADGGRSAVRTLAGIDFPGRDGTFTGMIADVRGDIRWPGGRAVTSNERGWAASFPFAERGAITRFNIVHAERRAAGKDEPVTLEEVRRCAEEIYGRRLDMTELVWGSRFDDTMRQADRLREGRVLLVGESARVHYPASGVGMNFCIQDAFNLGWKLGKVVRGEAADALLDTYEVERRPVADRLLEGVDAQLAIQFDFSPRGTAMRAVLERDLLSVPDANRAVGRMLLGLSDPYPTVAGAHPLEGRPFPEVAVQTGESRIRLAALLQPGDLVLLDLSRRDVFPPELRGTRVVRGSLSAPPPELVDATALLVRPDGYVQWVSFDDVPDAAAARGAIDALLDGLPPRRADADAAGAVTLW